MAIIRYDRGMGKRVTPSRTNIVRAQTTPTGPKGPIQGPALNPITGQADYAQNVVNQQRQTLSDSSGGGGIDINQIVSDALAGLDFGITFPNITQSGGGSGSSASALLNAQTEAARLAYDQAQAGAAARAAQEAAARARLGTSAQADALRALLATPTGPGSYREGADALLALINQQETTGRESIANQYTNALNLLTQLVGSATGPSGPTGALGNIATGYGNLRSYLETNAPRAFAQTTAAPAPTVANALAQYMQAQGATGAQGATQQEVEAQNAAAQAAQGNYTGLLDVLRRAETAGQTSRLSETEMARQTANTVIDALRARQTAALQQQQQTALDTLINQLTGQRFGVEQGATERKQSLQDALTALLGTGYNITGEQIAQNVEQNVVPAVSQTNPKLAKNRTATTDWQKLVQSKQPNFTGTWNEAKKKFPKLYKQYLDSQKKG